jgi:hypothetical protein
MPGTGTAASCQTKRVVALTNGTLVKTEDGEDGSISSADIEALVDTPLG